LKRKSLVCIAVLLFLSILLSGCVSRNTNVDIYHTQNPDSSLTAAIIAPAKSYFDEEIEFDASESYDSDGEIISYVWNFMDGETVEGKTVSHTFEFNDDYSTKFPLIYTVSLFVVDNDRNIKPCTHHILLYPKRYHFYFSSQEMNSIKPMSHSEKIESNKLFDIDFTKSMSYYLPESISIPASSWDFNLDVEKPFFSIITKMSISFFDESHKKILEEKCKLGLNPFWTNKKIVVTGLLDKNVDLKSINIDLSGFKLNDVNLIYGSEQASGITFNLN